MYLTRKKVQILYCRMLVVWIAIFALGVIGGCLAHEGADSAAFPVLAAPAATIAEDDHGDGSAHDMACKQFCQIVASPFKHGQSMPILSLSVFPLLLWVVLPLLTLMMVSGVKPIFHRSSGAASSTTHPYLLFQRFNN